MLKKAEISGLRYQNDNFHLRKSKVEVEKVERWSGVGVEGGKVYFSPGGVPPRLSLILHPPPVDRGGFKNQKRCVFYSYFTFFSVKRRVFVSHTVPWIRCT